jgi:hypothetical protein
MNSEDQQMPGESEFIFNKMKRSSMKVKIFMVKVNKLAVMDKRV